MAYNPFQTFIEGSDEGATSTYRPPAPLPGDPNETGLGSAWLPSTPDQQNTFLHQIRQAIQEENVATGGNGGAPTGAPTGTPQGEAQAKAAMLANAPRHHGGHSLATQPPHIQDMFWFHYREGAGARWLQEENDKYPPPPPQQQAPPPPPPQQQAPPPPPPQQQAPPPPPPPPKPEELPPIPAIPSTQQDIKNTGPITGAVEGQYFGDKEKYGLQLGKGGVAPGGGNPNEMYRWFKEAMIAEYPNAMDLWMKNPEEAIGAYNQWKIREQAKGRAFVGVKDDGTVGGGRLIPTDRLPDFQTDAAEERASAQQAATPGVGSGILGAIREGGNTFSGIEQGRDTDFSVWEELQRTGMTGSPFEAAAESYLKSQIPQFSAQGGMRSVRDQTPLGISDFLQQSYGGASMSPEDLRMLISGQPGADIKFPTGFTNMLDALDQKREAGTAFNLALAGSPLANAPMAIRNPLASQGQDYWNEYEQKLLSGEIEDVKGQADFLRFAAGKMGIV